MLTWETFISAWMDGCNDNNPEKLASFLSDDFKWATSTSDSHTGARPIDGLNQAKTLELVKTGPFADGANESTIFESEGVVVGTHTATVRGEPTRLLCVAKLRGDKVYEYHHACL